MSSKPTTLAIIPARGQSKGIPRKNLRLFDGKPLISHVIDKARRASSIDWVVVSSDDDEILEVARTYGADTVARPDDLATDIMTLDPAVHHAVVEMERRGACSPSLVATLQPTSPLLSVESIDRTIAHLKTHDDVDTVIAAVDATHLGWRETANGLEPTYTERVCRQWLQKHYRETGGIQCSRRECITPTSRIGKRIHLEIIPEREAIDIDNSEDWAAAEAMISRRRVTVVLGDLPQQKADPAFALINAFPGHDLAFICAGESGQRAFDLLRSCHYLAERASDADWPSLVRKQRSDALILAHTTSSADIVRSLKSDGIFVAAVHDKGDGSSLADVAVAPQSAVEIEKCIERVRSSLSGLSRRGGKR